MSNFFFLHLLSLFYSHFERTSTVSHLIHLSIVINIMEKLILMRKMVCQGYCNPILNLRIRIGLQYCRHHRLKGVNYLNIFEYYVFIRMLLLCAGDIELNPGSDSDNDSLLSDSSLETSDIIKNNFPIVHYNVQSAARKIDLIESEYSNFDVISITETWFTPNIISSDININGFRAPCRKDRTEDGHGGVAVYIKNVISCKRWHGLEIVALECVWLEMNSKRLLVGTFYQPPNSDSTIFRP